MLYSSDSMDYRPLGLDMDSGVDPGSDMAPPTPAFPISPPTPYGETPPTLTLKRLLLAFATTIYDRLFTDLYCYGVMSLDRCPALIV